MSENGGNGRNIGGRFGRDRMRFGINGKGMEWNMVHDMVQIWMIFNDSSEMGDNCGYGLYRWL